VAADCVSFWHGAPLGPVERACARSLLRQGHALTLYCYRDPGGVPAGVTVRDASAILPEQRLFRHRNGSPGMFADWFRYELLRQGRGTWVDLDLYFLAPLNADRPYLFGLQEPGVINNAVLRIPSDSTLLARLLRVFEESRSPPWLTAREKFEAGWKRIKGEHGASRLPWGATGPRALTALARELDLVEWALPQTVFYPVPWQKARWIADPSIPLETVVTDRTVAVHLWNQCIAPLKQARPLSGSFLERLVAEGGER
jgi:hypothetical protein